MLNEQRSFHHLSKKPVENALGMFTLTVSESVGRLPSAGFKESQSVQGGIHTW